MADGSSPVQEDIKVRIATPDEVDEVMKIALMGCEENQFVPHNPVKILQDVWAALNLDHGIVGVIGTPGKPLEAAVLLRVGSIWYSDAPVIEERAVYVHPSYRQARGGRAARLIEFSKSVADTLTLPLCIGVLSQHRTSAKVKTYSRLMGEPSGAYWVYWPKIDGPTVTIGGN